MHRTYSFLAALALGLPLWAQGSPSSTAPAYSAASIVNSASNTDDALAPNTIATIYGSNLADGTAALPGRLSAGAMLPQELADVRLYVAGRGVCLYYVSPQQINFLVPADLRPGDMELFIARDGTAGPQVRITLHNTGLGLYQLEPGMVASTHANGSIITKGHPARPGETVVVYGTGLGATAPNVVSGMVSMTPAQIADLSDFRVLVDGMALPTASVLYAGVAPGSPGLYQVNFKVPKSAAPNPEIRIAIGDQSSPPNIKLPLQ